MSHASDIEDSASVLENAAGTSDQASVLSLRTWTVPKLTAELVKRGIPFPASACKAELYRILTAESAGHSSEDDSMSTIQTSVTQLHALINNLTTNMADMQNRMQAMESRNTAGTSSLVPPPTVPPPPLASISGTASAVPNISPAHFRPAHIRKETLEGRDVNLASLLIATHDLNENKTIACGDVSVVLKSKDARLNRKLSLSEFIMAFSIFRDVICSAKPERREELDQYLYKITELCHKFGGHSFYQYHKSFSAKAATALSQYNYCVNWAIVDTELYCNHFSGLKPPVCATCHSSSHTTEWCASAN
ncbi:uncharacterized protein LOC130272463 [Hyla sarda]|uniref:uncharacterized protein LOC130272463 n=1 Tax=Hyla sarda TaxID=327740 RepID=UPI0024C31646|nr:uncharacterized protein LOC130272463 [Hyla sarda]